MNVCRLDVGSEYVNSTGKSLVLVHSGSCVQSWFPEGEWEAASY